MTQADITAEEWLEVVDSGDRIVGRRLRADIHRLGLRHRSTHILLFNSAGELFLQRRSKHKDINAGQWDTSAAGHVDPGESYRQCAVRELFEELGVSVQAQQLELLFRIAASETNGWEFIHVYRAVHDGPLRLNTDEVDEGRWLHPAAIDAWRDTSSDELSATFRHIWAHFRGHPPVR